MALAEKSIKHGRMKCDRWQAKPLNSLSLRRDTVHPVSLCQFVTFTYTKILSAITPPFLCHVVGARPFQPCPATARPFSSTTPTILLSSSPFCAPTTNCTKPFSTPPPSSTPEQNAFFHFGTRPSQLSLSLIRTNHIAMSVASREKRVVSPHP
jgi:hypothetical protein